MLALILAVAVVDYATGPQISISVFYMGPVALASWLDRRRAGLAISLLCAAAWGFNNVLAQGLPEAPAVPLWNTLVRLGSFTVVTLTVAALRVALERERALARTDPLTGLLNPRGFREAAELELARARRSGRPLTLVLLDLDDFKLVNDTHGHAEGDRLLATLAAALGEQVRRTDLCGRIGGDELALLLAETNALGATDAVHKLQERLREAARANGWPVDASIGWATFERSAETLDAAFHVVDERMYAAKEAGKGRAVGGSATTPQT